jgi:peptide deformylase
MAIRKTIQIGDPRLKAKNKTVKNINSPKIKKLIKDMRDTMLKNELIGLAAPQIGENYKIFVTQPRDTKNRAEGEETKDSFKVFINPKLIYKSKQKVIIWEGCGSVLNGTLFGPVKRPKTVEYSATDENGNKFSYKADGILGRVMQHEYDHLFGIEFLEKIDNYKMLMDKDNYYKYVRGTKAWLKPQKITVRKYTLL